MKDLFEITQNFAFVGDFITANRHSEGIINDTFILDFLQNAKTVRYVLQRINRSVFPDPTQVMENIVAVTNHLHEKTLDRGGDPTREALRLVPTQAGKFFYQCEQGEFWRAYHFIEGACTYNQVENPLHFYHAGRAFGEFQYLLSDFKADSLHETIQQFHDTPKRFTDFVEATSRDKVGRGQAVQKEINFILQRQQATEVVADLLNSGEIPLRVTHNDTKLNNIMIDDQTGKAICVLDLDTVMPGSALYDFGDAIRFGASTATEDERNLDRVELDLRLFQEFSRGYLKSAKGFLTIAELEHLAFSAKLITLEQGMRFLEDYLNGDKYYKTEYAKHNLDRARTQLKLVWDMEKKLPQMETVIKEEGARK